MLALLHLHLSLRSFHQWKDGVDNGLEFPILKEAEDFEELSASTHIGPHEGELFDEDVSDIDLGSSPTRGAAVD